MRTVDFLTKALSKALDTQKCTFKYGKCYMHYNCYRDVVERDGNILTYLLHGHDVFKYDLSTGDMMFDSCGFPTPTTRDRLNVMAWFFRVPLEFHLRWHNGLVDMIAYHVHSGKWYLVNTCIVYNVHAGVIVEPPREVIPYESIIDGKKYVQVGNKVVVRPEDGKIFVKELGLYREVSVQELRDLADKGKISKRTLVRALLLT